MQHFTMLSDVPEPIKMVQEAEQFQKNPFLKPEIGKGRCLGMIFLNASLRTRLSTHRAAQLLGMDVMVMNMSQDSWQLETRAGVIMKEDRAEHIEEAAAVMGQYCDIIAIRSFAALKDAEEDKKEVYLEAFKSYSGVPILNMESCLRHPLQSLADMLTIEGLKKETKPKIVMTWAPHIKALPHAVPQSFLEWAAAVGHELSVCHPEGYALGEEWMRHASFEEDREKALAEADIVYVKNWSSTQPYGQVIGEHLDWTLKSSDLSKKARVMHCLPVRRNLVIEEALLKSEQAVVIQQAANRVPAAQAALVWLLNNTI